MQRKLEVCVDTPAGARICGKAGVDRIELCSALSLGGLTPTSGLMQFAVTLMVPVHVMIRPRIGNFTFDADEIEVMCVDIAHARRMGLAGVVLGVTTPDGQLDADVLRGLIDIAGPLEVTLHRVVDTLPNPVASVDIAIDLGFNRILTSGGAVDAGTGATVIAGMFEQADGRIEIMAGSGVNSSNLSKIASTGVHDFHASCRDPHTNSDIIKSLGFGPEIQSVTSADRINEIQDALSQLG